MLKQQKSGCPQTMGKLWIWNLETIEGKGSIDGNHIVTGSLYNGSYALYMANVFYDRGYNVLTFRLQQVHYLILLVKVPNSYSGNMTDDVSNLYDIIANEIIKTKKDGMDVSDTYIRWI